MSNKSESCMLNNFTNYVRDIEEERDSLKGQLQNAQREVKKLKDELSALDKLHKQNVKQLQLANDLLKDQETKVRHLVEERNSMYNEIEKKATEVNSLRNEKVTLTHLVQNKTIEIEQQNLTINKLIEEKDSMKSDLDYERMRNSILQEKREKLETELEEIKNLVLTDNSRARKRKIDDSSGHNQVELEFSQELWSMGHLKVLCPENFAGDFIVLSNESDSPVDINEWRIELPKICDGEETVEYAFAPRIIPIDSHIKLWSAQIDNTNEDENNLKLNIDLPKHEGLFCLLKNDMDELEASFRIIKRRKTIRPVNKRQKQLTDDCDQGNTELKPCLMM